jgi:hypothetical protein
LGNLMSWINAEACESQLVFEYVPISVYVWLQILIVVCYIIFPWLYHFIQYIWFQCLDAPLLNRPRLQWYDHRHQSCTQLLIGYKEFWLVVWKMSFMIFHILGIVAPTD